MYIHNTRLSSHAQNLFYKAALLILQDRLELPPAYTQKTNQPRVNKWVSRAISIYQQRIADHCFQFSLDVPESDVLLPDVRVWRNFDVSVASQPPIMIVDLRISSKDLKDNQTLVVTDEFGKTRYVEDAVKSYYESLGQDFKPGFDIVVERWQFDLDGFTSQFPKNLVSILPKTYKNAVVLFRALFSMLHLLPAWSLSRKSDIGAKSRSLPKLSYRIYEKSQRSLEPGLDGLHIPLPDSDNQELEDYIFETLDTPAGKFKIKVSYRKNCDFQLQTSEATISSRIDESDLFKPSLRRQSNEFEPLLQDLMPPPRRSSRQILQDADQAQQAYGSLSTYHLAGRPIASSPLSTLRAVGAARELNTASPRDSPPSKLLPEHRNVQDSHETPRSEAMPRNIRRTSVTFSPFKSPSLSASPSHLSGEHLPVPQVVPVVGNRSSALTALAEARNPGFNPHTSNFSSTVPTSSTTPLSASPRPTSRHSASYAHRRSQNSLNLGRDDDLGGSSRTSPRPGTAEGNASSGSLNADDDNISEFLKMLDNKKELKSFRSPSESGLAESSARRTSAALSRYSRLRDSNAILSDSVSSSVLGHRSSTSSSRQLSSVPAMVGGASLSTASSPGERMSPRTPHTPAIPSRLSANSIVDHNAHRERNVGMTIPGNEASEGRAESVQSPGIGAIDIPSSPRVYQTTYRRPSSVAQQRLMRFGDDDLGDIAPFENRSTSLGGNREREPLSLSRMLASQDEANAGLIAGPTNQAIESAPMSRQRSTSSQDESGYNIGSSSRGAYRARVASRGHLGRHGSSTSLAGERGSASGGSDSRGGRYSFQRSRDNEDEELLFAMSDFGVAQQGRRSLEEAGRGNNTQT